MKVKALGNQVLVELLSKQEIMNTTLYVGEGKNDSPQGVVADIGPLVNKDYGLEVGARVIISGTGTPVPKEGERERVLLLPDSLKGVIVE